MKSSQVRYYADNKPGIGTLVEISLKLHVVNKSWKHACNLVSSNETDLAFDDESIPLRKWELRGKIYMMQAGGKPVFSHDPELIYRLSFPPAYTPIAGTLNGKLHFGLVDESGRGLDGVREIQIPYDVRTAKSSPQARGSRLTWVNIILVPVRVVTETGKIILGQAGS